MKSIAFFNNKGGVGKTSLVYHLAWMFADRGVPVLAIDLDPQSNLTSMFLHEERLEELWSDDSANTISDSLKPQVVGTGDILPPHVEMVTDRLGLVAGNLALARYEDTISLAWKECFGGEERGFRITSAFYRIMLAAIEKHPADIVLIDVGPNLGAINRSALIAAENVVLPLAPDLFSLQGLRNLGPTLKQWRELWNDATRKAPLELPIPSGRMAPIGYIVMQYGVLQSRPVKAYERWLQKIPSEYRKYVLDETLQHNITAENDPYKLAQLKHYRSLMPLAQEANKPIFHLKPADGAIGAHLEAVRDCYNDFLDLAKNIASKVGVSVS